MKTSLVYIIILILVVSCSNEHRLTFESSEITREDCQSCPIVSIVIPKVLEKSKTAESINSTINEEIISMLIFDEQSNTTTVDEAIDSFSMASNELKELYSDESAKWEATINGEVTYEDENILTIKLDSYLFTGGAHGYQSIQFLNFDKNRGLALENWQLFKEYDEFNEYVETEFRLQEKIPEDKNINVTGFMFENDSFYLPENIGFTDKGLHLLYNQYEIASYADGQIELILPYKGIKKYLVIKPK